jgi:hypothetical protein
MSLNPQPHLTNPTHPTHPNEKPPNPKGESRNLMLIKIILISMLALNIFALLLFIIGAIVLISVAKNNKYLS